MSYLQDSLDLVEFKKTLEFFKEMGFSDRYVQQIARELMLGEQRYARTILANLT